MEQKKIDRINFLARKSRTEELTPEEKEIVLSVARAKPGKLRFPVAYTEVDSIEGKHIVFTLHYYLGGTATYQHDGAMYECIDPLWT